MLTWGVVSMATAFVQGQTSLMVLRFLLGVAEAGFFSRRDLLSGPVVSLRHARARFVGLFLCSISLANIVGAPLRAGSWGSKACAIFTAGSGLFLLEGLPSFLARLRRARLFAERGPRMRPWLSADEKALVAERLAAEPPRTHDALWPMLGDGRVWALAIPDFGIVLSTYGVGCGCRRS